MNFVKSSMVASIAVAAINTAVAATYSHSGLYDIQLNTIDSVGGQPLLESSTPVLTSSTEVGTNYDRTRSRTTNDSGIESDISIAPEVGVPGQIDFYYVTNSTTTTTTYDQDFKRELSSIEYTGSVAEQTSASSYSLNASLQRNAEQGVLEYTSGDDLYIGSRMTVQYTGTDEYVSGSMFGALTINYTDGIDNWTTSHQQEFVFGPDNYMSLNFSDYYNFDDTISFDAIFEVYGSDLSYAITNLRLGASTFAAEYGAEYNIETDVVTTETGRFLVGSEELPALPEPVAEVPVPAAVWLFGTGLIALAGLVRRKAA